MPKVFSFLRVLVYELEMQSRLSARSQGDGHAFPYFSPRSYSNPVSFSELLSIVDFLVVVMMNRPSSTLRAAELGALNASAATHWPLSLTDERFIINPSSPFLLFPSLYVVHPAG